MGSVLRAVAYVLIPTAAAIVLLAGGHGEAAVLLVSVFVLLVTTVLLEATRIGPAQLTVQRQHELGYSDVIFYMTTEAPRDILVQMHVAVINTGGRKGVLSKLELHEFRDSHGNTVRPYQMPFPLAGRVFRQSDRYSIVGGRPIKQIDVETHSPPLVLEPDDVVTLQFRTRRGIDWGSRWTLDEIQRLLGSLGQPIAEARVTLTYRRGRLVVTQSAVLPVECLQQEQYLVRLRELTKDGTVRPDVAEQPFEIE